MPSYYFRFAIFLCFIFCFSTSSVFAEELTDPGQITFRNAISDMNSEEIDPYTGHLSLTYTDLHLPGNGGLDLRIARTYKSSRVTDQATAYSRLGHGWDVHFGKVKLNGKFVSVELNDGTVSSAIREKLGSEYFLTKDFWKVYWPTGGYPSMQLTDGTIISYQKMTLSGWYLATEIKKNNNTIIINYNTSENISTVSYKAGQHTKTITFNYTSSVPKRLRSITWGSPAKQIQYNYTSDNNAISSVVLPGGDTWKYSYIQKWINNRTAYIINKVTNPWGGLVTYDFDTFGKPIGLSLLTQGGVSQKQVSGRGLATGTWTYNYTVENGFDATTVTDSCGRTTTHKFYGYGSASILQYQKCYLYGLPISKTVMQGSTHELTTEYTWGKLSSALSTMPNTVYALCSDTATDSPVITSEKITRGGKNYTTTYSDFDSYGSPKQVVEQGTNTKTTTLTYWYDTAKNIVKDKPLSIKTQGDSVVTGTFTTTNSYYTNASTHKNYYGNIQTASQNGVNTSYQYDTNGNISSITDANNKTISYQWDHGSVSRITNPYYAIGRSINWDGTVASETNGRGYTTSYLYDGAMRLTKTTPPVGNTTTNTYEYDSSGYFNSIKKQRGATFTRSNFDGLGRESASLNSLGVQTSIAYSPCGKKQTASSNIGDTTSFDTFERPIQIVHKDNKKVTFQYVDDLHVKITNEDNLVTHNYLRSFGNPYQTLTYRIVDSKSQTTDYSYNILGSLRTATGLGRTDSYSYNTKNFLTGEYHPESGSTSYGRDNVGNLKSITDSLGTRTYTYDDINRLKSIASPGGTLSYNYDNADNPERSESPDSVQTYVYDQINRLTQTGTTIQGITKTVGYDYDANDNLTLIDYPNGMAVTYGYNSLNQVTSVDGFGAKLLSVTYSTTGSKIGLMSKYVRSNGQVVTFSHDNRRRPSRSTYPNTDLGYNFNARGNLDNYYNYKDGTKNKSFGYDALNRLTTFNGPWGNGSYQYNASGDRTQKKIGSNTTSYSYINHLLSGSNYSFNADGDMTRDGDISFEYDRFHNVKRAIKSSSPLATYGYDSSKQRVYKIAGDSTTLYFNDFRGNTLSELTGDGTPLENYIYLGDKLISKVSYNRLGDVFRDGTRDLMDVILGLSVVNGETPDKPLFLASDVGGDKTIGLDETIYDLGVVSGLSPSSESEVFFYDTDYLGTSITLSDASGNVVWQVDELPFGEEYEQDGIPDINKRRYIGKEKDVETGLLYFGARYLNASDGRFISSDPVGLVDTNGKVNPDILSDPQRLNRYAYGLNNPYRYVDPDGEFAFAAIAIFAAGAWALDAIMPHSTDVSESKGFLDHADNATMLAGVGSIRNVTKIPKAYKNYSQARNAALKWLEKRGFSADKKTIARLGDNKGKAIGMKTSDGKTGFRVEYDKRSKAHINVFAGKEKGPHFKFEGTRKTVNKIVKRFKKR